MYTIDDLNVRLLSELKDIAEGMGVKNAKKLAKQELIYKILDQQAITGDPVTPEPKKTQNNAGEPERKMRPRKRENVAPQQQASKTEEKAITSDELLQSIDLELNKNIARFEDSPEQTPPKLAIS